MSKILTSLKDNPIHTSGYLLATMVAKVLFPKIGRGQGRMGTSHGGLTGAMNVSG